MEILEAGEGLLGMEGEPHDWARGRRELLGPAEGNTRTDVLGASWGLLQLGPEIGENGDSVSVFFVFQVFISVSIPVVQTLHLLFWLHTCPQTPGSLVTVFLDSENVSTVYIWSTNSRAVASY